MPDWIREKFRACVPTILQPITRKLKLTIANVSISQSLGTSNEEGMRQEQRRHCNPWHFGSAKHGGIYKRVQNFDQTQGPGQGSHNRESMP